MSEGNRRGRKKGVPNKVTTVLKEAILRAAEIAGDDLCGDDPEEEGGMVGYLVFQAKDNPTGFMTILGKVLPLQVNNTHEGGISITVNTGVPRAPDE